MDRLRAARLTTDGEPSHCSLHDEHRASGCTLEHWRRGLSVLAPTGDARDGPFPSALARVDRGGGLRVRRSSWASARVVARPAVPARCPPAPAHAGPARPRTGAGGRAEAGRPPGVAWPGLRGGEPAPRRYRPPAHSPAAPRPHEAEPSPAVRPAWHECFRG